MKVPETDRLFTLLTIGVEFGREIQCIGKSFILPSTVFLFLVIHIFAFNKIHQLKRRKKLCRLKRGIIPVMGTYVFIFKFRH
jgi:hypothetical protein